MTSASGSAPATTSLGGASLGGASLGAACLATTTRLCAGARATAAGRATARICLGGLSVLRCVRLCPLDVASPCARARAI